MEVVTVIPTRGLIFAETLRSLKDNGIKDPIIISGKPIPDSHNEGVRIAMQDYFTYLLFVEDDMVIPPGTVQKMMKMDKGIVAVDYPMENGYSTICRKDKEILWCGMGCTLIKRGILSAIGDPWFRTDYSWKINEPFSLEKIPNPNKYGGHDINFCMRARELGFSIHQLMNVEAEHLRCKNLQKRGENDGTFEISPLPKIYIYQNY